MTERNAVQEMPPENMQSIPYEVLANELFKNYECIYDLDLGTGAYNVYYESNPYSRLDLTRSGSDFFTALEREVAQVVVPEDQGFVLRALSREALESGVQESKHYSLVYRISRDGRQIYHQLRATLALIDGQDHVLMGVRDVDTVLRENTAREDELSSERQRAENYLGAVLATAAAYTEANLTADRIIEQSVDHQGQLQSRLGKVPSSGEMPCYSEFQSWAADNIICENRDKYLQVSSRESLLDCFEKGDARASVSFSATGPGLGTVPCRAVFYLYRDDVSGDVHALCVIYDYTNQQRQEKELEQLKADLEMSRIHNSASQMKPHFLYNALGSIQEVMLEDPERAAKLLEDFTVHLRSCIKAMDGDYPIPFSQELENIRAYTSIEKMRLGDKLEMRYELDATEFDVLPLTIQPVVENAIRHGVYHRGARGGTVTLRTRADNDSWVVQVEDTGMGFDVDAYEKAVTRSETDSTGLKNIRLRLEIIMGASLSIESKPKQGTTVTVRIPKGDVLR